VERSSFVAVKREADRAIAPMCLAMVVAAPLTAGATFLAVLWAWASEIPDWAYEGVALLANPLVALALALVYLAGRMRIRRRVVRSYENDSGYGVLAEATQRGALLRYNVVMALLAICLFVGCEFALAYLGSRLYADEEGWDEEAQPSATQARALPAFSPYFAFSSSAVQRSSARVSSSSICA
jgi:hypothetical protein